MSLNEQVAEIDKLIEGRFREHELADIVQSVPGIGPILGAEFLASVGGSLDDFASQDALAAFAGVAPAPKDSGKVSGNLHRPMGRFVTPGSSTCCSWPAGSRPAAGRSSPGGSLLRRILDGLACP